MMAEELSKVVQRKKSNTRAEAPCTSSPAERKRRRTDQDEIATSVPLTGIMNTSAADDTSKCD